MKKAAIYHFTNKSEKRPSVYQKQLEELTSFAYKKGYKDVDIYCDMSLKKSEHHELDRLFSNVADYDAVITKDFYHISKNTSKCFSDLTEIASKGIPTITMKDGTFFTSPAPLKKKLKVATYSCFFGTQKEMDEVMSIRSGVFSLFCDKKTRWIIEDMYFDRCNRQSGLGIQVELDKFIENKKRYDLLLVHNFNDIRWRTTEFAKIRNKIGMDIYSLQEGFWEYNTN